LDFLRSTRNFPYPWGNAADQLRNEQQMELSLVGQMAARDPRRSFQLAEDSLKGGLSRGLINVLY